MILIDNNNRKMLKTFLNNILNSNFYLCNKISKDLLRSMKLLIKWQTYLIRLSKFKKLNRVKKRQ